MESICPYGSSLVVESTPIVTSQKATKPGWKVSGLVVMNDDSLVVWDSVYMTKLQLRLPPTNIIDNSNHDGDRDNFDLKEEDS